MALRSGVAPFENVRDALKDWYPHSEGNLIDLVHPSLYPPLYGSSRFPRSDNEDEKDVYDDDGESLIDSEDEDYYKCPHEEEYIMLPDPDAYVHRERKFSDDKAFKLEQMFANKDMHVIVKLVNIHLSPEKPSYDGGRGNTKYEGRQDTDSYLAFRENADHEYLDASWTLRPGYEQHYYGALVEIFGLHSGDSLSALSQVLARKDRLLVFLNILQHCVQSLELADATKPGHRKSLALFIVDPNIPILSTANVPAQQRDCTLSIEQAKQVRAELMAERGAHNEAGEDEWHREESYYFSKY